MPTKRTQYPKARPINSKDSAANFPNRLTYPNGTYASTGAIGGTGGFGANLPLRNNLFNNSTTATNARFTMQPIPRFNLPNTSPIPNVQSPYAAPVAQGSFVSGSGQVNLQGVTTGGRGNMNPTTQNRINAYAQQAVQTASLQPAPRPTDGLYVPGVNDDAWISYWNKVPLGTPRPMSRDQIWNMKAQARKRRNEEREQDDNNRQRQEQAQGVDPKKAEPAYQPFFTKTVGFRTGTG